MKKEKHMLLKAKKENWGLMHRGDWREVEWRIFTDGSYEINILFNDFIQSFEVIEEMRKHNELPTFVETKKTGRMNKERFIKLQSAIKRDPWRDPSLVVHAHDGEAWEIEAYKEDGSIEKTSGRLGYIYGHLNLETITSLLPAEGQRFGSSAYVSVSRK